MVIEKQYLTDILKEAGIKGKIYTSIKKLTLSNEYQTAAVLKVKEKLTRSGSRKKYTDQAGQRMQRCKLWDRESKLRVIIADTDEDKVEEVLTQFLKILDKGIVENRNWEGIDLDTVDWVEREDSLLKAKVAAQFDITFTGGVYVDKKLQGMGIGNIEASKEDTIDGQ